MSSETETNLADAFADTLDSAERVLSANEGDDRQDDESEALDTLRERLARLSSDVDEASTGELLAAAGVSPNGDGEGDEGEDGSGDSLGPADLPRLLDSADDESVGTLRKLLDLAELGSDAPEDDATFGERLREVLGDDGGGSEDVEGAPADDDGEQRAEEETDAGETADEEDGLPTVADVVSGSVSFARDWSDARNAATSDEDGPADADDGSEDDEDDGWFDFDDFPELDEDVDGEDRDSRSRGGRQSRYSTLPGSRSDMGRATRFSSVKARK